MQRSGAPSLGRARPLSPRAERSKVRTWHSQERRKGPSGRGGSGRSRVAHAQGRPHHRRRGYRRLRPADPGEILGFIPEGAARIYVGKQAGHHCVPQAEINRVLVRLARTGRMVVRLKGGDPFISAVAARNRPNWNAPGFPMKSCRALRRRKAAPRRRAFRSPIAGLRAACAKSPATASQTSRSISTGRASPIPTPRWSSIWASPISRKSPCG